MFLLVVYLSVMGLALKAQVKASSKSIDKDMAAYLEQIYLDDQHPRFDLFKCMNEERVDQDQVKVIMQRMRVQDSINLEKVTAILKNYGWLGPDQVGANGSQTLFLVIQHAPLSVQEKYLPLVRKAEKDGKVLPGNLAILEDRIALHQGRKQSYGSQVYIDPRTGDKFVQPLDDPDRVDIRRKSMGMPPMKEYLHQSFKMSWDVQAYKKSLPEIERRVFKQ